MPTLPLHQRLLRHPLDGVVAIVAIVHERLIEAFRMPLAARVLHEEGIARLLVALGPARVLVHLVLAIGRAHHDARERTLALWQVEIARQLHAVAHRGEHLGRALGHRVGRATTHLRRRRLSRLLLLRQRRRPQRSDAQSQSRNRRHSGHRPRAHRLSLPVRDPTVARTLAPRFPAGQCPTEPPAAPAHFGGVRRELKRQAGSPAVFAHAGVLAHADGNVAHRAQSQSVRPARLPWPTAHPRTCRTLRPSPQWRQAKTPAGPPSSLITSS